MFLWCICKTGGFCHKNSVKTAFWSQKFVIVYSSIAFWGLLRPSLKLQLFAFWEFCKYFCAVERKLLVYKTGWSAAFGLLWLSKHLWCLNLKRWSPDDETSSSEGDNEDGHDHHGVLHRSGEDGPMSSSRGCWIWYEASNHGKETSPNIEHPRFSSLKAATYIHKITR